MCNDGADGRRSETMHRTMRKARKADGRGGKGAIAGQRGAARESETAVVAERTSGARAGMGGVCMDKNSRVHGSEERHGGDADAKDACSIAWTEKE